MMSGPGLEERSDHARTSKSRRVCDRTMCRGGGGRHDDAGWRQRGTRRIGLADPREPAVLYYTKGSGSNGVNTVYFLDTTGQACPDGVGLPAAGAQLPASPLSYDPAT